MGREEKAKEAAIRLGKYNVKVLITFLDGEKRGINAYSWTDMAMNLAITTDQCLVIIPHSSIKYFEVHPQNSEKDLV